MEDQQILIDISECSKLTTEEKRKKVNRDKISQIRKKLKETESNVCFGNLCEGKIKALEEFSCNGKGYICKDCNADASAQSYEKHGKNYQVVKYSLKLGQKCEICGCDDIELLEFDHVDPSEKEDCISSMQNPELIIEEAKKIRILCIWCHRIVTHSNKKIKPDKIKIQLKVPTECEKIQCNGILCNGKMVSINNFYKSKDKIKFPCKKCKAEITRQNRLANANHIRQLKLKIGECHQCHKKITEDTIFCFDFDHLTEKYEKSENVSRLAGKSYLAINLIDEEVKKCQMLCCICHKKKTIKQLGYKKPDELQQTLTLKLKLKEKLEINKPICIECGKDISYGATRCASCDHYTNRVVEQRPSLLQIYKDLAELKTYVKVGKKYNVTDNAVRKWIKNYLKNDNRDGEKIKLNFKKTYC